MKEYELCSKKSMKVSSPYVSPFLDLCIHPHIRIQKTTMLDIDNINIMEFVMDS